MKVKLDENIGIRGLELLRQQGHDVSTVYEQGLSGMPDEQIFHVCADEGRVLITLDRDFGEVLRFPPAQSAGLVILDLGPRATHGRISTLPEDFPSVAQSHDVTGELWIVEPGRVRIHLERE